MPLQEILKDLISMSLSETMAPGGLPKEGNTFDVTPEALVENLEGEYKNLGEEPMHFVGLLLAVFPARVVSGYQKCTRGTILWKSWALEDVVVFVFKRCRGIRAFLPC
jgi:hypothetical protein